MTNLTHYTSYADAQAHCSAAGLWELFDGDAQVMQVKLDGYQGIGVPVRLSQTPGRPTGPPPRFGQHAREVLGDAGFDEGHINRLQETGVCP